MDSKLFIVTHFYADTKKGTGGILEKEWCDPSGSKWIKLFFGRNLSGQKLSKSFPADCLQQIAPIPELILDHFGISYITQNVINEDFINNSLRETA